MKKSLMPIALIFSMAGVFLPADSVLAKCGKLPSSIQTVSILRCREISADSLSREMTRRKLSTMTLAEQETLEKQYLGVLVDIAGNKHRERTLFFGDSEACAYISKGKKITWAIETICCDSDSVVTVPCLLGTNLFAKPPR